MELTARSGESDSNLEVVAMEFLGRHGGLTRSVETTFHLARVSRVLERLQGLCYSSRCLAESKTLYCRAANLDDPVLRQQFSLGQGFTSIAIRRLGMRGGRDGTAARWRLRALAHARRALRGAVALPSDRPNANLLPAWVGHALGGQARRQSSGHVVGHGGSEGGSQQLLVSVFVEHERLWHAERHALVGLLPQRRLQGIAPMPPSAAVDSAVPWR